MIITLQQKKVLIVTSKVFKTFMEWLSEKPIKAEWKNLKWSFRKIYLEPALMTNSH